MSLEHWAFAAALVGAGFPVVFRLWRGGARGWAVGVAAGLGTSLLAAGGWRAPETGEPPPETAQRPIQVAMDDLATSRQCRSCHPDEHHSWHQTYHRTMTTLASPATVKGDFNNAEYSIDGKLFRMMRRGKDYWVEMDDPNHPVDSPAAAPRVTLKVEMITGSHHMQVYWHVSGVTRQLRMFPVTWLIKEERWAPEDATFLRPPEHQRNKPIGTWNINCIRCHATRPNPGRISEQEMYSEVGEFGIACEACHAPAATHVKVTSDVMARYKARLGGGGDVKAVNPPKLDPLREAQICGRCHGIHDVYGAEDELFMAHGNRFKPGDTLEPFRRTLRPSDKEHWAKVLETDIRYLQKRFWSDGLVRVTGREYNGLVESPCFKHDDDDHKMTCLSCHQMHRREDDPRTVGEWTDDLLKVGMRGNAACLQCHEEYSRDLEAHTRHPAGSAGSLCYNCHMPHTSYGLMTAIRGHTVTSPAVGPELNSGRPNACNQCHFDRSLAWTAEKLRDLFGVEPPELTHSDAALASIVRWSVKGDAGMRALAAWNFGWEDAKLASRHDWAPVYLLLLMEDPYPVVRKMAFASLKRLPGYEDLEFDFAGPPHERVEVVKEVHRRWNADPARLREAVPSALIDESGSLDAATFEALLKERDLFPLQLVE